MGKKINTNECFHQVVNMYLHWYYNIAAIKNVEELEVTI